MKKSVLTLVLFMMLLTACAGNPASEKAPDLQDKPGTSDVQPDVVPEEEPEQAPEVAPEEDAEEVEPEAEPEAPEVNEQKPAADPVPEEKPAPAVKPEPVPEPAKPEPTPQPEPAPAPQPEVTPEVAPQPEPEIAPEVAPEAASSALTDLSATIDGILMEQSFAPLDDGMLMQLYGLDASMLNGYVAKMPMISVRATEYFLAEVKDGNMDAVLAAIVSRQAALENQWAQYLPEQYEIVKKATTTVSGNYVLFVVSEFASDATAAFKSTFA